MGYGLKFYSQFESQKGINYKVRILQKDYDSTVYDVVMGGEPVIINYNGGEDKFDIIRGSECVLNLYSQTNNQFTEILIGDKGEYKVEILKNDSLFWSGFVIQDNYTEPFMPAPYLISVRATDGLGDLKMLQLKNENGNLILNNLTFIETILSCLRLLKNGTKLITNIDLYESRVDRNDLKNESLNKCYVSPFLFLKDNQDTLKLDAIIKMILAPFNAYIYFKEGNYHIDRVNAKVNVNRIERVYDINFDGSQSPDCVATTITNTPINISSTGSSRFINANQTINYSTPIKSILTDSKIINSNNLIVNNYFRIWENDLPINWETLGTFDISKINYPASGDALKINQKVTIDSSVNLSTNQLSVVNSSFVSSTTNDSFSLTMASFGNVRFMVKISNPTQSVYLTATGATSDGKLTYTGGFSTTPSFVKLERGSGTRAESWGADGQSFYNTEILDVAIPISGSTMHIAILPSFDTANYTNGGIIRQFTPKISNTSTVDGDRITLKSNKNYIDVYEDFKSDLGEFNKINYLNQILIKTPTGNEVSGVWYRDGRTESKQLLEIAVRSILNQNRVPYIQFTGSLYGDFDFGSTFTIQSLDGKFFPYKASINLKNDTVNADLLQLLGDEDDVNDIYKKQVQFNNEEYTAMTNRYYGGEGTPRPTRTGGANRG